MSSLKYIYSLLRSGVVFGSIEKHNLGGTYFWEVLYADDEYIHWRHYGSSANKLSLQNLEWILETIFEMTPEVFLFTYHSYEDWICIDSCYKT